MKLLATYVEKCVQCKACEEACAKAFFKETDATKAAACSRIQISDSGSLSRINVCTQCGACINVCPTEALERDKNGVVQLRKDKCTSCLMCVGYCPSSSMRVNGDRQTQPYKCIACGICAKACPVSALEVI